MTLAMDYILVKSMKNIKNIKRVINQPERL